MTLSSFAVSGASGAFRQRSVAGLGLVALGTGALALGAEAPRLAALFLVGGAIGVALYHAGFGFASAYRHALVRREVAGVEAQLVMIALAMVLFAPLLSAGEAFGHGVVGAVAPVGVSLAVGSLLFGLGMQLGGGCGSGTLYTVGGGSLRMLATLAGFCAGAFWGSLDMGFWLALPSLPPISLAERLGWAPALALQGALLGLVWIGLRRWARGAPHRPLWTMPSRRALIAGPWPLAATAVVLALLNAATLAIAGHPWSITWGFTLWGAEAAQALGWDPASSAFWRQGFGARALAAGPFADVTSVMNLGIVAGAFTAAGLAGRFAPRFDLAPRALIAALVGGVAMGYGARLAFGCNIGAFFSGVASTSLHGWAWIVFALIGTWAGVRLRPLFGLRG